MNESTEHRAMFINAHTKIVPKIVTIEAGLTNEADNAELKAIQLARLEKIRGLHSKLTAQIQSVNATNRLMIDKSRQITSQLGRLRQGIEEVNTGLAPERR